MKMKFILESIKRETNTDRKQRILNFFNKGFSITKKFLVPGLLNCNKNIPSMEVKIASNMS